MAKGRLGIIDGQKDIETIEGLWKFDDEDWALIAMLQDPILCAELLFEDPNNKEFSGCYHVRDYQYPLFRPRQNYNIAPCARDVGKALPTTELVLTPTGWTKMGHLRVGDEVIGADGRPTAVTGVYPQGPREIVELRFADGATVECDYEHLWWVTNDTWKARGGAGGGYRAITARRIADTVGASGHTMGGARQRWRTPLVGPVQFEGEEMPLDPYLLGLLLGDGNLTRPTMVRFASIDDELVEAFRERLDDAEELVHDGGVNYRLRRRSRRGTGRSAPKLLTTLRTLGLMGHAAHQKFIPPAYLTAAVSDRLALLQGLVDTDGHVVKHSGGVDFSTASNRLASEVRHLVLSLGGRCAHTRRPTTGRDSYRLHFRLPAGMEPARLTRKRLFHEAKIDSMSRAIVGAVPVGLKDAVCIKVAAEDGLFVTRDFVVTHNTESIKARAVAHVFRRIGEDLLLTAPQMIHLNPLTEAVEERLTSTRLTRDFLKRDAQRTGFKHNPFQADFMDGTSIVGRIPHLDGKGVKGMHEPDLIGDEMQDYPEAGWTEVFPTVMKDHMDSTGKFDFTMTFYGVHAAAGQGGAFGRLAKDPAYDITVITRLQTPWWSKEEKRATAAMYGGVNTPDYKRNVLGEPGQAFSQFFATARLVACMDQDKESHYNSAVFKHQELQAEEVTAMIPADGDVGDLLDLPQHLGQSVYCGMDVGLVTDPTVIMVWAVLPDAQKRSRLQLIRMIHLWRFTEKQIRQCTYRIARQYGATLRAFGQDITGLGLPLYQAMESDEQCPDHLQDVAHGYVFNAKVPVAVAKDYTSKQGDQLIDQYGHIVEVVRDKWTGQERLVAKMTMIEASTRYLRGFVDETFLLLPFHDKLIADFQGETEQRVRAMAGVRKKPSAFHMLDAARCMAMAYKQGEMEEQVYDRPQQPVLDRAVYIPV